MAAKISIPRATTALRLIAPKSSTTLGWRQAIRPQQWQFQVPKRAFSASSTLQVKKYTEDHEWVEFDDDGKTMTLGISKYASEALGDVVYIELPELGLEVGAGDAVGAVESVKSASDILSPLAGTVVENNSELEDSPAGLNADPEGDGWICRIQATDPSSADELMDEAAYKKFTDDAAEKE